MNEQLTTPDVETPPAEVSPPTEAPSSDVGGDDLDGLLEEYRVKTRSADVTTGNGEDRASEAESPTPRDPGAELRERLKEGRDIFELQLWASGVERERLERRELEDANAAIEHGRKNIADLEGLAPDFADRWLRNQVAIDPELHDAWNRRYESREALNWCRRCVRHAMNRLYREAKSESERIAGIAVTEDRSAIIASMMRGTGQPPPSRPPDLTGMTDQQLREYTEKTFGFSAL
jgi:hypothetical protein